MKKLLTISLLTCALALVGCSENTPSSSSSSSISNSGNSNSSTSPSVPPEDEFADYYETSEWPTRNIRNTLLVEDDLPAYVAESYLCWNEGQDETGKTAFKIAVKNAPEDAVSVYTETLTANKYVTIGDPENEVVASNGKYDAYYSLKDSIFRINIYASEGGIGIPEIDYWPGEEIKEYFDASTVIPAFDALKYYVEYSFYGVYIEIPNVTEDSLMAYLKVLEENGYAVETPENPDEEAYRAVNNEYEILLGWSALEEGTPLFIMINYIGGLDLSKYTKTNSWPMNEINEGLLLEGVIPDPGASEYYYKLFDRNPPLFEVLVSGESYDVTYYESIAQSFDEKLVAANWVKYEYEGTVSYEDPNLVYYIQVDIYTNCLVIDIWEL